MSAPSRSLSSPVTNVELVVGELFDQSVDAIIVPYGYPTRAESRVQLALGRLARASLAQEVEARLRELPGGRLPMTHALVTASHGLPCRHLVHMHLVPARQSIEDPDAMLRRSLANAFAACRSHGASSVALPAVGTGSYGHKVTDVALASVKAAIEAQLAPGGVERVRFVLAGPATLECFLHAMSQVRDELAREGRA